MATRGQIEAAAREGRRPRRAIVGAGRLGDEALVAPLYDKHSNAERVEKERALTYLCKMVAVGKLDPDVFVTVSRSLGVIMSDEGLYAILEGKYKDKLAEGKHFWCIFGVWSIENPNVEDVLLDQENLINLSSPQCALCGADFRYYNEGEPCRGL